MEHTATVILGLTNLSDSRLLERARNHITMLTGNDAYKDPVPKLGDLELACNDLDKSIQEVILGGGRQAYQLKRTRRTTLHAMVKQLAGYVQATSGGDKDLILSAGFTFRQDAQPVEKLEMPQNLRALLTDFAGQVPLRWDKVKDAQNYLLEACKGDPTDEKNWELVAYTSRTGYTVEALQSVTFYYFRVQALGRKGLVSPRSVFVRALAA